MATNDHPDEPDWVDERLKALETRGEFQADASQGWTTLQTRQRAAARRARRGWTATGIMAIGVVLFALPWPRAMAQRLLDRLMPDRIAVIQIDRQNLPESAVATFTQSAQVPPRCLHGPSEQPDQRTRREQALRVAQQINRAENAGVTLIPGPRRNYRPLSQLENVSPAPVGFRVQLDTDGRTYTFSVKDTLDACNYAIFSDQNSLIYEGTARVAFELRPIDAR